MSDNCFDNTFEIGFHLPPSREPSTLSRNETDDQTMDIWDMDEPQHERDFPCTHVSLPFPAITTKNHSIQTHPGGGRLFQHPLKILVLALSFTVVAALAIALGSFAVLQRRNDTIDDQFGNKVDLPPGINDNDNVAVPSPPFDQSFTTMPSTRRPTFSPMRPTNATTSPVVTPPTAKETLIPEHRETQPPSPTTANSSIPTTHFTPVSAAPVSPRPISLQPTVAPPVVSAPLASPKEPPPPRNAPTISPLVVSVRPTAGPLSSPVVALPTARETKSPSVPSQPQNDPTIPPAHQPANPNCHDIGDCGEPTTEPSVRAIQPVPTRPVTTRPPTNFMPIFIAPTPYKIATETPTEQPLSQIEPTHSPTLLDTECNNAGDCQIISIFPYLRDYLCFDEELGIAEDCALSCGLCGNVTIGDCVDDQSAFFFVSDYWGHQSCKWLSTKAEVRGELCEPGQEGYHHCPRLCGRCHTCQDDFRAAIFISYTEGYKTCAWLSENPTYQSRLCQPDEFGYESCKETCGRCSVLEYASRDP